MVNEIFISKISEISTSPIALRERLQHICEEIYLFYHVEICFCQVIKSRWSHFVSTPDFVSGSIKISLTAKLGLLAPEELTIKEEWPEILEILKKIS